MWAQNSGGNKLQCIRPRQNSHKLTDACICIKAYTYINIRVYLNTKDVPMYSNIYTFYTSLMSAISLITWKITHVKISWQVVYTDLL